MLTQSPSISYPNPPMANCWGMHTVYQLFPYMRINNIEISCVVALSGYYIDANTFTDNSSICWPPNGGTATTEYANFYPHYSTSTNKITFGHTQYELDAGADLTLVGHAHATGATPPMDSYQGVVKGAFLTGGMGNCQSAGDQGGYALITIDPNSTSIGIGTAKSMQVYSLTDTNTGASISTATAMGYSIQNAQIFDTISDGNIPGWSNWTWTYYSLDLTSWVWSSDGTSTYYVWSHTTPEPRKVNHGEPLLQLYGYPHQYSFQTQFNKKMSGGLKQFAPPSTTNISRSRAVAYSTGGAGLQVPGFFGSSANEGGEGDGGRRYPVKMYSGLLKGIFR